MGIQMLRYFLVALFLSMLVGLILFSPLEEGIASEEVEEESAYENIYIRTIIDREEDYKTQIEIPIFQYEQLNIYFAQYAEQVKQQFLQELEELDSVDSHRPGDLIVGLEIYPAGEQIYSLVFAEEAYTGGANVNQRTKVEMVDLNTGELIDRDQLFNDPEAAWKELSEMVAERLEKSEYYKDYILDEELSAWKNQTTPDFHQMFIRDGEVVFKFNKYEVVAGVAGMPEIGIPIKDAEELFHPEWLERLNLEQNSSSDYYL
ncbi:DUF3298 and DUF4163 domain-containing protein [Halalkalibacillus halophilus]|uniref:DUF3298 and DUF4163 domain-containing protein n=1 Tax=Halalkalibacillus halophilus TaxID=392827 RepID=UPI00040F1E8B|nr:DUF3298 and DUF4163 domain-containing protein [Halalkalibacillus halophilus]